MVNTAVIALKAGLGQIVPFHWRWTVTITLIMIRVSNEESIFSKPCLPGHLLLVIDSIFALLFIDRHPKNFSFIHAPNWWHSLRIKAERKVNCRGAMKISAWMSRCEKSNDLTNAGEIYINFVIIHNFCDAKLFYKKIKFLKKVNLRKF